MKLNLFASLLIGILLLSCNKSNHAFIAEEIIYESDLEQIIENGEVLTIATNQEGVVLENGQLQSQLFARSGENSVRIDSSNEYGMNFRLYNLKPGEFFRVSVWQKKGVPSGCLIGRLTGENYNRNFRSYSELVLKEEGDWVMHQFTFVVELPCDRFDSYVFAGGKESYFDDLKVERYKTAPETILEGDKFNFYMKDSTQFKMNGMISFALKKNSIPAVSKKYVKGKYIESLDTAKIKLKLKGDYTDHLESGKTSYRVKIKGDYAFRGLKEFSIQHAQTRNYLDEWFVHKMAETEDVLATKYDFTPVVMNDINLGLYAIEEHFVKQLLERQNRREGPILKMDESGAWAYNYEVQNYEDKSQMPYFDASVIRPFKSGRTIKDAKLRKQFEEGNVLLNLFKNGHVKLEDIFDVDEMAKFYALNEFSGNNHGLAWHNRRFYYNPVNQKLEHILFDVLPFYNLGENSNYMRNVLRAKNKKGQDIFDYRIFSSQEFKDGYIYYLDRFTQKKYIDSLFNLFDPELEVLEKALNQEMRFYSFDREKYYENALFQQGLLMDLDREWQEYIDAKVIETENEKTFVPRKDKLVIPEIALNIYQVNTDGGFRFFAENYHVNPVRIVGYKDALTGEMVKVNTLDKLEGYTQFADTLTFELDRKPKKIYFVADNNKDTAYAAMLFSWEKESRTTVSMRLDKEFDIKASYYSVKGNQVVFSGKVVVDKVLMIPENYEVVVEKGTSIELKNGGGIIVNNNFYAEGTAQQPIRIFNTDGLSNGLTILKGEEAVFSYVNADGVSNLSVDNWELTGAITIYETITRMSNCTFSNNRSEDALNIIRSHFSIIDLYIHDTYSDGFDADFCTGTIESSKFERTGNDCMDFSGSNVTIKNVKVIDSGDKGVSGGEASNLVLENITIEGAVTGIAAKDASKIRGHKISILRAEYGCAAFRKKPEYSMAKIDLKEVEILESVQTVLVDMGSSILLNDSLYESDKRVNVDSLYARFEK